MLRKIRLISIILSVNLILVASPYKKVERCQPNSRIKEFYCGKHFAASCTTLHPTLKKDDPLPDCCAAVEKNAKVHSCSCRGVNVDVVAVGTISHERAIVEYSR